MKHELEERGSNLLAKIASLLSKTPSSPM